MYAKPVAPNGSGTKQRGSTQYDDTVSANGPAKAINGPGQYSLLGHDKYENVDLNEIQKAP